VSGYCDQFALDRPTWRYYHDGQAPFEDDVTYDPGSGTRKDVTRYALGARGGDMAETVLAMGSSGERAVRSYPLYDGHGNTVGQVARAEDDAPGGSFVAVPGAPAFELGARRKYDAWGQVRWSEGSPLDQGYCGSLQHRRDAESGLVYMRARYYEPWTGRFLSEDPPMDGANWYVYCSNDPVAKADFTGNYEFHIGDYYFRLDNDLGNGGDLHIKYKGTEVLSRWADGSAHHKLKANKYTKDIINTLGRAAKSGDLRAIGLLRRMSEAPGKFGAPEKLFRIAQVNSVVMYSDLFPDDFLDIIYTIMGG
jgi:RHS repeat-associated protein